MEWNDPKLVKALKGDGVVIMPADTLYGIVGRAESQSAVSRIYSTRDRDPSKPCIILIGNINELKKFYVNLSNEQNEALKKYWPGPVSIIFDCEEKSLEYLHRGTKTLAFRLPSNLDLQNLLKETGPLVAPSANPQGLAPAKNIKEAEKYFGDLVDLYIDGGEVSLQPSKVIRLFNDGSTDIIRP